MNYTGSEIETAITKERGFLVGFWDVVISAQTERCEWVRVSAATTGAWLQTATVRARWATRPLPSLFVEVKARPVDVAAIARQIETYGGATRDMDSYSSRVVVVATCYPMPKSDRDTLAAKHIHHVYLGDGFSRYMRDRDAEGNGEQDEL